MKQHLKKQLLKALSRNLIKLRKQHGLTQEQVADSLEIDIKTYQHYEKINPPFNIRLTNLYEIAQLYHVSLDDLIK